MSHTRAAARAGVLVAVLLLLAAGWKLSSGRSHAPTAASGGVAARAAEPEAAQASSPNPRMPPPRLQGTTSALTSTIPAPNAFANMMETHMKHLPGKSLREWYNGEPRRLPWAEQMENQIRARFRPGALPQDCLAGMEVTDVECRESTCRVELQWPVALDDKLRALGVIRGKETAVVHLAQEHAHLGPMTTIVDGPRAVDPTLMHLTYVVAMSEDSIDPARYGQWAADVETSRRQARKDEGPTTVVSRPPAPGQPAVVTTVPPRTHLH